MAEKLTIKYLTDSVEGDSLSTTVTGPESGWVEYCNQRGQLFYAFAVSKDFFEKCQQQAIDIIVENVVEENKKNLGFIHHLSNILINDEFVLPMFGILEPNTKDLKITAGTTRMVASIINGRKNNELNTVVFVPKGQAAPQLEHSKPLTTTANFVKIYNLADIDYEIGMSDSAAGDMSAFSFDRSVLKHSIYDKKDQALPHTQLGSGILGFWNKHVRNDKILLNIRCTPEVEKLIQPSKIFKWNVIHENADEWIWSYGKILSSYRKKETPLTYGESHAHLWLYDVTEPVHLELLIPWMTGQYTCGHTKNKKALLFDTSADVTSMQVIGDWVR